MARSSEERARHMAAVADEHDKWVMARADDAPFRPEQHPDSADYSRWHVDVEASGEDEDQLAQAIEARTGPADRLTWGPGDVDIEPAPAGQAERFTWQPGDVEAEER